MANIKNKNAIARYLAYTHLLKQADKDFKLLEYQLREEKKLYEEAIQAAYGKLIFFRKVKLVERRHQEVLEKARMAVNAFDEIYRKIESEIKGFSPKYRKGEPEYNKAEFKRYCKEFARKYGSWFWDITLQNDPLDDCYHGSHSIAYLIGFDCETWYSGYQWEKWFWHDVPYGARLMELNIPYKDYPLLVLQHQEAPFTEAPSEALRKLIA